MKLKGKIAVITGAGSGIGKAQALLFAKEGAVVVAIDVSWENVHSIAEDIIGAGGMVFPVRLNVTDEEGINKTIQEVLNKYGKIDILCNTAGVLDAFSPSLNTTVEVWDRVMNINVRSVFILTNAVLPNMLSNKNGCIINMASIGAFAAGAGGAAYTTAKHAVVGYTRQLTMDYAKDGIRVNAIAPGLIETPLVKDFFENKASGVDATIQSIPAKRPGRAEEVANLSLFLASDDSSYFFGSTVVIDGGVLARLK